MKGDGLKAMIAGLEQVPKAVESGTEDYTDALFAVSQDVVPVDEGTLKKSGSWHRNGMTWIIVYTAPYAHFIEWGYQTVKGTIIRARSYLRIPFHTTKDLWPKYIERRIKEGFKE